MIKSERIAKKINEEIKNTEYERIKKLRDFLETELLND